MATKQQTLTSAISFSGKGLHTGLQVEMTVHPAEENTGIIFRRVDLEGQPEVPALCEYVTDTSRGTTIEKGAAKVSTIEHIISALWTLGVDNAIIDINAPETPIMDGSAKEYAERITEVGMVEQEADRKYFEVTEKQVYTLPEKGVAIVIYPDDEYSVSVHVDYNSKVVGNQYAVYCKEDNYSEKIAMCRTFVFLHELEPLLNLNLIKGGDLDNAIVVVENPVPEAQLERLKSIFGKDEIEITGGYLNNQQLRANNELARHKLLDLLGDFALLGMRIKGRVWATRPGHFANTEFMKELSRTIRRSGEKPTHKYSSKDQPVMDINKIKSILPHRPPFLLIDRVAHIDENFICGIKQVSMNEPFFVGHFPEEPIMPGVLIIEAMAQCCGIHVLSKVEDPECYSTYFLKADGVKWKRKVVPGDTLQIECHGTEIRRGICTAHCKAFVGGQLVSEAMLTAQIIKNR
ncbi:MAG: bifunctional UDP-3-O-[3-hydroxymyristoyl] N-acetylglucosamine deacetylase/3-hydroxyacyl-ACP dehydratase [Alistipes sp.]|nr:bifunctional UDP-3-O-[3-hydroxymyristoyl] N-acetylglucosamine deacetylase/3-hydroxyacyl-ACP dehydratase [Alistipes sp.]MBO7235403.1 bifunctional UDP-3-O-[3-hydroxymyristoyl] N-acetylglucosamine deacetylase/3-hydroxyacyl-ACP dehydratase [Alistipes sp.]